MFIFDVLDRNEQLYTNNMEALSAKYQSVEDTVHHNESEHARAIDQLTFELQASQASMMEIEEECGKLRSQSKQLMETLNEEVVNTLKPLLILLLLV